MLALIVVVGYSAFLTYGPGNGKAATQSQGVNQCNPGFPSPALAPEPGFRYFAYYNISNGAIVSVETRPSCQVTGLPTVPPQLANEVGVVDVTSSTHLTKMMPTGYLNAFYINFRTLQLTIKPGVTFTDPSHGFYNGQQITDSTEIPIRNQ